MNTPQVEAFADKVRAAYFETFGDNPWKDTDVDPTQPAVIGPILICFDTSLAEDDNVVTVLYDGTTVSALGLATHAQRLLLDNLQGD